MEDGQAPDMAEKLRAQIVRMAAGNGVSPEAVILTTQHTTDVKLQGQLDVRLIMRPENAQGKGPAPAKWHQQFDSPTDIAPSIIPLQNQLAADPQRLQFASEKILQRENQGWGITADEIAVPELNYIAGTQYACSNCDGTKQQTCGTCHGSMRQTCSQCHGKRETICPTCSGRGTMSSGENCAACRTRGVVPCAQCQGQGETGCTSCGGKGQVPCKGCDAKGTLYQQVTFNAFAQANFKLMLVHDLPEDAMRHIRKLKPEYLLDGRATIIKDQIEQGDGFIRIHYHAEFPLNVYQFQIQNMPVEFVTLGNKGTLFEAPNFMDRILSPSLDMMRRARKREIPAAEALQELGKMKFYRAAFSPGPKNMQLRRRYPFGLSGNLMREVPASLHYLLSVMTERPRVLAAVAFNAIAAIILLSNYIFTSTPKSFSIMDIVLWIVLLALNAMSVLFAHYVISSRTLKTFGIHKSVDLQHALTALGKTGTVSLGVTLALCIMMRLLG